ncbi:MAG: hypothetical protein ACM3MK_09185 [Chitinophagales bacterium]
MDFDSVRNRLYWLSTIGWFVLIVGLFLIWCMVADQYHTYGTVPLEYLGHIAFMCLFLILPGLIILFFAINPISTLRDYHEHIYNTKILRRMKVLGVILSVIGGILLVFFMIPACTGSFRVAFLGLGMSVLILGPGVHLLIRVAMAKQDLIDRMI